jgi:hypothetical protein
VPPEKKLEEIEKKEAAGGGSKFLPNVLKDAE